MIFYHGTPRGHRGWAPIPKKLRPASISMAAAKLAAEITITAAITFGKNVLKDDAKGMEP